MKDLTKLKPNELIRLAITDMKATIEQGNSINMNAWGKDVGTPKCSVCFAGSIMLQQGKKTDSVMNNAFDINDDINRDAYLALDHIRQGHLSLFCQKLNIPNPSSKKLGVLINRFEVDYIQGNEEQFYTAMENAAKLFD